MAQLGARLTSSHQSFSASSSLILGHLPAFCSPLNVVVSRSKSGIVADKMNILDKIRDELKLEITSERQVLYILVEIRKFMEQQGMQESFPTLTFHCNWIAHSELRGPTAQAIVKDVDTFQRMVDESMPGAGVVTTSVPGQGGVIAEFFPFRTELAAFLASVGFNEAIVQDNGWWSNFMWHYANIIQDCPLRCISQGLKHANEVVVRVINKDGAMLQHGFKLVLEWSWQSLKTGTTSSKQTFFSTEPQLAPPLP